ncbi:MAG: flavodoxin family protein [candidate division WS1 bacterium]|jgi:multimeric flavodoxin WrbA|nr:flavodoxin family protein [candidate division WS1 bacterium]
MSLKVLAVHSSPRKEGNTAIMVKRVFAELNAEGIETEMLHIAGKPVRGCMACRRCYENRNGRCVIEDDFVNDCLAAMAKADGIILASPTYFGNVTTEMKALIDRGGYVSKANGDMLKGKVAAAVSAVRRAGSLPTLDAMNHLLLSAQMYVVGSSYWNLAIGRLPGEVEQDEEGMGTMAQLGKNMAWLLKKLHGSNS